MGIILGATLIAGLTLIFAVALLFIRSVFLRWLLAVTVPVLACLAIYWSNVWMGGDESEYAAWSGIFIAAWYLPSYLVAAIFVYMTRDRLGLRARNESSTSVNQNQSLLFRREYLVGREYLGFLVAQLVPNILYMVMYPDEGWFSQALLILFMTVWLGIPSYLLFKRMDWLRFWRITLSSALLGLIMGMWFVPLTAFAFSASEWRDTLRLPAFFCLSSALVGAVFWLVALARFGRGPRKPAQAGL